MRCFLKAYGTKFDVDRFLSKSNLRPCEVWHKGDSRLDGRDGGVTKHSGMIIEVSDNDWDDLDLQIRRAMRFLKRHESEIHRLSSSSTVQAAFLDFGVKRKSEGLMQGAYLPADLIKHAGRVGVGIRVTAYPFSSGPTGSGRSKIRTTARGKRIST